MRQRLVEEFQRREVRLLPLLRRDRWLLSRCGLCFSPCLGRPGGLCRRRGVSRRFTRVCRFWKREESQEQDESNEGRRYLIYHPPVVVDCDHTPEGMSATDGPGPRYDLPRDDDTETDADAEKGGIEGHDGTSFVQEEDIGDGEGGCGSELAGIRETLSRLSYRWSQLLRHQSQGGSSPPGNRRTSSQR